ncbi:MAG TPA: hypothetical protein VGV57_00235 [Thermoleophilaceae bacterium]|nr:hypothetical protein [Thermoleophilaceae bacterium]
MPTEPEPLTVAEAVQRAAEVADPSGVDADIGDFVLYLEDADEPITAVANLSDRLEEARRSVDPEGDLPGVTMTAAVANYLAYRRDELDDRPEDLLRLAARAEFEGGEPPDEVAEWLAARGVEV